MGERLASSTTQMSRLDVLPAPHPMNDAAENGRHVRDVSAVAVGIFV